MKVVVKENAVEVHSTNVKEAFALVKFAETFKEKAVPQQEQKEQKEEKVKHIRKSHRTRAHANYAQPYSLEEKKELLRIAKMPERSKEKRGAFRDAEKEMKRTRVAIQTIVSHLKLNKKGLRSQWEEEVRKAEIADASNYSFGGVRRIPVTSQS